ncbi:MAG: hypothetical protein AAGN66_00840 [Acidobacteriota bacterium]
MTVKVDLEPELGDQVKDLAEALGKPVEVVLVRLIEDAIPRARAGSGVELLDAWAAEDSTDDPVELDRRRRDLNGLQEALDEERWSDRPHFP